MFYFFPKKTTKMLVVPESPSIHSGTELVVNCEFDILYFSSIKGPKTIEI